MEGGVSLTFKTEGWLGEKRFCARVYFLVMNGKPFMKGLQRHLLARDNG